MAAPVMKKLESRYTNTVANLGMFLAKDGVKQPDFQEFLGRIVVLPNRLWSRGSPY